MNRFDPDLLRQPRLVRFIAAAFRQNLVWAGSVMLLRSAAFSGKILWPLYVKFMTDELVLAYETGILMWDRIILINVVGVVAWFIEDAASVVSETISGRRTARLRMDLRLFVLDDLYRQSQQFFNDRFAGSISTSLRDLSEAVSDVFAEIINYMVPVTLMFMVLATIFLKMDPFYIVVMLVWMLFQGTLVVLTRGRIQRLSRAYADRRSEMFGKLIDSLSNNATVTSFAARDHEMDYLSDAEGHIVTSRHKVVCANQLAYFIAGIFEVVAVFSGFILVYFYLFQQGKASVGDFMFMILGIYGMMSSFRIISNRMFWLYEQIGIGNDAIGKIIAPHRIVDHEAAKPLEASAGRITLENIGFSYFPGKKILQDIAITIPAGQKTGLVGYSGAGKTTLVNLLLRFYDPDEGRILIDGQDIGAVTQTSLRRAIAMIPQDTSLFNRSLRDNIRIARPDADDAAVIRASTLAGAHDFIMSLPQQYDTLVGERGVKLSGGQRQRIAIARAFLKDAPILILDEATSALDSMTEHTIQNALDRIMDGRTTLVIAHRLSTLSRMDRILVFSKGRIIEQGSHDELLAMNGHYARMWSMQAGGFIPELPE